MDIIETRYSSGPALENMRQTSAAQKVSPQMSTSKSAEKVKAIDKIVISAEGKATLADESNTEKNQDAVRDLAGTGKDEVETEKSVVEAIDKQIEELKEKVRELMQQLAQLKPKDDEQSMAQREILETKIAALNSQIMSLTGMKREMMEQE